MLVGHLWVGGGGKDEKDDGHDGDIEGCPIGQRVPFCPCPIGKEELDGFPVTAAHSEVDRRVPLFGIVIDVCPPV